MSESQSPIKTQLACIILAAGQGTRMRSEVPKVLHRVAGLPMVSHAVKACAELLPEQIVVVVAPGMESVEKAVAPNPCVIQSRALGTGDAVKAARQLLNDFKGDIVVLFGDGPLVTAEGLEALRQRRRDTDAAIVVSAFRPTEAGAYGRLVVDQQGRLTRIVEASEANEAERAIPLCNGGMMLFAGSKLFPLLDGLRDDNSKKEFYLTDAIALAVTLGDTCAVAELPPDEVYCVNNRVELAHAEALMQKRLRSQAMLNGATLTDPETVYLAADTRIGRDVTIGPNVVFGPGVEIGNKVEIRAFCSIEQTRVEDGAIVGPYARLRPGTVIGSGAHIGNFVEIKNAEVSAGAKVNHLSYIGDAFIGPKANIGAGTITCNYDGYRKHHTHIGAGVFIGSNTALVAPVRLGDGAFVGAGSVITMEVPADTLAVARGRQSNIGDWARRYREEQMRAKDKT